MRIIVADCSAEYSGRLNASLPLSKRVLLIKEDGSVLIFSELGSYKPLNWMAAPCTMRIEHACQEKAIKSNAVDASGHDDTSTTLDGNVTSDACNESYENVTSDASTTPCTDRHNDTCNESDTGIADNTVITSDANLKRSNTDKQDARNASNCSSSYALSDGDVIKVSAKKGKDVLTIVLQHVYDDQTHDLGEDPGLVKDGVEDHLQRYLAEQIERIGKGASLVRREYPTAIGPVDIMAVDSDGVHVAIEIKRHGGIDGVEQLTRYCELLNRDPLLKPVRGIFAAQTITPQARVLAHDRGFTCLILDYDEMRDTESDELRLF